MIRYGGFYETNNHRQNRTGSEPYGLGGIPIQRVDEKQAVETVNLKLDEFHFLRIHHKMRMN